MRRRAFTLLELLIALAVMLAVAGMALPALWGRLADTRLDSAIGQFGASVVTIRARAQERGEPLELLTTMTDGAETLGARALESVEIDQEPEGAPASMHALAAMPGGIRLSLSDPRAAAIEFSPTDVSAAAGAGFSEPRRLAVFMPDGSVVATGPVYLALTDSVLELTFNRWTGGIRMRELPALQGESPELIGDELMDFPEEPQ